MGVGRHDLALITLENSRQRSIKIPFPPSELEPIAVENVIGDRQVVESRALNACGDRKMARAASRYFDSSPGRRIPSASPHHGKQHQRQMVLSIEISHGVMVFNFISAS
jgi:hypothetical protein